MVASDRVIVVGAGIGGLVAALDLAAKGVEVLVLERARAPGGKMREIVIDGRPIDSGPTVFTMRWVFEEIFADAGTSLEAVVGLERIETLARHAWSESDRLDLFSDLDRSADAIGDFAGAGEAKRFLEFAARAEATYKTLEAPFIRSEQPSPVSLAMGAGLSGLGDLWRISPFSTLWSALGDHFRDPRLRQLFGRYATYCGSSPFDCPATLMLVAHVEQAGVWRIAGGMHRLAVALAGTARAKGAEFRYGAHVAGLDCEHGRVQSVRLASGERLAASAVVFNGDPAALADGHLGREAARACYVARGSRSLSAMTWSTVAETRGFPLSHHNVFFSRDYTAEFDDVFSRGRVPAEPTVYICAEDRAGDVGDGRNEATHDGAERLLLLINAPPIGDERAFPPEEIEACRRRMMTVLARSGLKIGWPAESGVATTPADFNRLFPATGGALYGQASHGWTASFTRPTARTRIEGLYLAGGATHPGPGVPMAALSGRLAARRLLADWTSRRRWRPGATFGGTSTP